MEFEPKLFLSALILAGLLGYTIHSIITELRLARSQRNAHLALENAKRESEVLVREARVQARDEALRAREQQDQENWNRRQEIRNMEERMNQRGAALDRKAEQLDRREAALEQKQHDQERLVADLNQQRSDLKQRLQQAAGLSAEKAKVLLMEELREEVQQESGALVRRLQEQARDEAKREATRIITTAIQRYAGQQVSDITTSTVALPNDEMKGRIIGREGRNIKAFEAATGVNLIIDETPEVVVLSAFDPLRREVAKQALEQLIADGRIHPSRIEEVVQKVQAEVDDLVRAAGEEAVYQLGLAGLHSEVVRTLGRLNFRQSYGQNVLQHSREMAHLMAMMAGELGLDAALARRCGLLHDIGKALDPSAEGGHALAGADFLRKHGESPLVVNAVAAHHEEVEAESLYAVLVKAADALTAARPGARHENTEIYVKRLEKLEEVAKRFKGVEKCYAIQAGREIRVVVEPSQVNDDAAMALARDISKQIEEELDYPGQIRVTVVRETRCVEFAK